MRAAITAQCVRDQPSDGSAQSSIAKSIVLGDRQNPAMLVKTSSAVYKISICAIGNQPAKGRNCGEVSYVDRKPIPGLVNGRFAYIADAGVVRGQWDEVRFAWTVCPTMQGPKGYVG